MTFRYPTAERIRSALIGRIAKYARLTGKSPSLIGLEAVADMAFVGRINAGGNFTIDTYGRVMAFLDANWPSKPRRGAAAKARRR